MHFTLRELECFIAVAEELSFTRAAARLRLAQPPLSRHVRTLEERLGVVLFIREARGVSLTQAGRVFWEETKDVPLRLERAGEMARRCGQGETLRLRLGFVSAVMNPEMVNVLRIFREKYPSVQVTLEDCPPGEQLPAVANGGLDAGFVGLEPRDGPPGLIYFHWYQEPLVCLMPAGHRLAGESSVSLEDLGDEPFIAVSKDSAPAFSRHWRDLCLAAGLSPRIIIESPRAQAVAAMVGAGSGIAILPAALATILEDAVAAVKLRDVAPIRHVLAAREDNPSVPLRNFARLLKTGGKAENES